MNKNKLHNKVFWNWNFDNITFDMCGLDKDKNFLQAPLCECGCGNYMDLCAYDDEIDDLCKSMLAMNDSDYCGIFAITSRNSCLFFVKTYDDEEEDVVIGTFEKETLDDYKELGWIENQLHLDCYGLLVYRKPGSYRIVMK